MRITDKKIIKSAVINLTVKEAWSKWTTHEGLLSFFGKDNNVELKLSGAFEIYFLIDNPYGLRGSEGCKVLSYLPEKMLSFSWNAPPIFPEIRKSEYKTWVVVEFYTVDENQTRITLTHLGWPDGDNWSLVFDYFDKAWAAVLNQFKESVNIKD